MTDLISIIVPIYNVAEYLHECIDSIINQTYKNIEIILVDDGSTDNSGEICDEYAKKDNRIIVVHQENKGLVAARKSGLSISHGKYIGYVDGDDWIEPQMYEHMLGKIIEFDVDFITSGCIIDLNNQKKYSPIRKSEYYFDVDDYMRKNIIKTSICGDSKNTEYISPNVCSKLMKKELLFKCQYLVNDNICYGEDLICTLYMIHYSKSIGYTDKYYYHYRIREQSITNQSNLVNVIPLLVDLLKGMYNFIDEFNYDNEFKKFANFHVISAILSNLNRIENNNFKKFAFNKYPFENELESKQMVLYGARIYGKDFYKQFIDNKKINIVCWADKNYKNLNNYPMKIETPENIKNYDFDYIIIAVRDEEIAENIKNELLGFEIPKDKMLWNEAERTLDWLYK